MSQQGGPVVTETVAQTVEVVCEFPTQPGKAGHVLGCQLCPASPTYWRRVGLALLAAAARAEELLAGVSRLDAFRRGESPSGDAPAAGEVRELKPRRRR